MLAPMHQQEGQVEKVAEVEKFPEVEKVAAVEKEAEVERVVEIVKKLEVDMLGAEAEMKVLEVVPKMAVQELAKVGAEVALLVALELKLLVVTI